jgi:hypothetical protein
MMILETIFSLVFSSALFITGGHLMDTKFGLHHYSDEDYKEVFWLKNKSSISKNCIRHSELEDIEEIKVWRNNENGGEMVTAYKVTKSKRIEAPTSRYNFL